MLLTVSDTADVLATEDRILVEVSKTTSLLDQSGRETVCEGLVVNMLGAHIVVDLKDDCHWN